MEEDFKKLLECNRGKFRAAVAAERLLSPLAVSHVISAEDLQTIQNESPSKRLDKLIDILKRRDYGYFKKFCVVLETTYPYMLNCMFLGVEPPASGKKDGFAHANSNNKLSFLLLKKNSFYGLCEQFLEIVLYLLLNPVWI